MTQVHMSDYIVKPTPTGGIRIYPKPKLSRDLSTPENRAHWEFVRRTAEEVRSWPAWKRGG